MKFSRVETSRFSGDRGFMPRFVDNLFRVYFQPVPQFSKQVRTKMFRKYSSLSWKWNMARIWTNVLFFGMEVSVSISRLCLSFCIYVRFEIISFFPIYRKSIRIFVSMLNLFFQSDLIVIGFASGKSANSFKRVDCTSVNIILPGIYMGK